MIVVGRRDLGDVAGEMDADVDCVVVDVVVVVFMIVCVRWALINWDCCLYIIFCNY